MKIANFLKKPKTSMSYLNNHIEDYIMFNYVLNKNLEKSKNQRFYRHTNLFFGTLSYKTWVMLATWLHLGSSQKYRRKLILYPTLNTKLFLIHTKLGLGVLDIVEKLAKDVI